MGFLEELSECGAIVKVGDPRTGDINCEHDWIKVDGKDQCANCGMVREAVSLRVPSFDQVATLSAHQTMDDEAREEFNATEGWNWLYQFYGLALQHCLGLDKPIDFYVRMFLALAPLEPDKERPELVERALQLHGVYMPGPELVQAILEAGQDGAAETPADPEAEAPAPAAGGREPDAPQLVDGDLIGQADRAAGDVPT